MPSFSLGHPFFFQEIIMSQKSLIKDLTKGPVMPLLLQFAFPIMLSNLLQIANNMADMVIIGRWQKAGSFRRTETL